MIPRYSSHKVYISAHGDYYSPEAFGVPKRKNLGVFRILHPCNANDDGIPYIMQVDTADTNETLDVIFKVNIFASAQSY